MKIYFMLVCTCAIFSIKKARGSAIGAPFYPLNPEDLSEGEVKELEYWDKYYHRPKRFLVPPDPVAGSAALLTSLKSAAIASTKEKIGSIASGSAAALAGTAAAASTGTKEAVVNIGNGIGGAIAGIASGASSGVVGVAKGTFGAVAGSALALHQLKTAAAKGISNQIDKIASGSAQSVVGASSGLAQGSKGALINSKRALDGLKTAALTGISNQIGQVVSGSARSLTGASAGVAQASGKAIIASKNTVKQIETAAWSTIGKTIGLVASGSAKTVTGIASGAGAASAGAVKNLKTAALTGITSKAGQIAKGSAGLAAGLASAGSAGISNSAKGLAGAAIGSASFIDKIKSAVLSGLTKSIGLVATGSVKAATGASSGIKTKVGQVSVNIATGAAESVNQLKHAVVAGTKRNLGQAASSLAGAVTGAVGSASAGAGQLTRGVLIESANLVDHVKTSIVAETGKKIGLVASGSAGIVSAGSAGVGKATKGAFLGSAKTLALGGLGTIARGSAGALAGSALRASVDSSQAGTGAVTGSIDTINQIKHSAIQGVHGKLKQAASFSATALTGASDNGINTAKSAVTGSSNAVLQLKSAALQGTVDKIKKVATGSIASAVSTAVKVSETSANTAKSALSGSVGGLHQLKSTVITGSQEKIASIAKSSIGGVAGLSGGFSKRSIGDEPEDEFLDLPKRSESPWPSGGGSADIISQLKTAVVSGLTKKIGQVAKGSIGAAAGASAGFSKGSSGGGAKEYHPHPYEPGPTYDHKPLDVWQLKKSVLNTLLQAVKAIKGGVLAIKGQLIKGSGYIVSGGGKLISASGDKVTGLGKTIINNAILVPPHKEHIEYGPSAASYTAPSGPPIVYNPPAPTGHSGPSYESHYEGSYDHLNDKLPHGSHSGILILRRMKPTHDKYHASHSHPEPSRIPAFKPLGTSGPSVSTIFGKFFTASTSLDPSQPTAFDDPAHGIAYGSIDDNPIYTADDSHSSLNPPAPPYYEEPRNTHNTHDALPAPPSFQAPLIKEHKNINPTVSNADFSTFSNNYQPPSPLATSYGVPFEEPQNYLNINDYLGAEASNNNVQRVKLTKGEILDHLETSPTLATSEVLLPKDAPSSLDSLKKPFQKSQISFGPPLSPDILSNSAEHSGEYLSKSKTRSYLHKGSYPQKDSQKHFVEDSSADSSQQHSSTYTRSKNTSPKSSFSQNLVPNSFESFLPKDTTNNFSSSREVSKELSSAESYQKYLETFPFHKVNPRPSLSNKGNLQNPKLRMQSDHRQRRPSEKGNYSVVRSVSYELTPDGAKRLT